MVAPALQGASGRRKTPYSIVGQSASVRPTARNESSLAQPSASLLQGNRGAAAYFGGDQQSGKALRILHVLGILFIIAWLVLWLAVKVTFAAIHALVVIGVLLIIVGLLASRSSARS